MALLKNPNEITKNPTMSGLIYGQPGIGKSTLALSAPSPVLIDADKGLHRVDAKYRVPSLPLDNYKDVIDLFQGDELKPFETIVFDTFGKLLDRMGEYVIRTNPKNGRGDGALSLQGYGALKGEFQKLLKMAQSKGKNLIFVAHEKEEKDGDTKIVRPDAPGSAGKDLVKDLDFMGYMEMKGDKRTISFSPSEKFYAKNSLKLEAVIDVPDTGKGNDFIKKNILEKTAARLEQEEVENQRYQKIIDDQNALIDGVSDPETAGSALAVINDQTFMWDSQRIAKKKLNEKVKAVGLEYKDGKFVKAEAKFETEQPKAEEPKAETGNQESAEVPAIPTTQTEEQANEVPSDAIAA